MRSYWCGTGQVPGRGEEEQGGREKRREDRAAQRPTQNLEDSWPWRRWRGPEGSGRLGSRASSCTAHGLLLLEAAAGRGASFQQPRETDSPLFAPGLGSPRSTRSETLNGKFQK